VAPTTGRRAQEVALGICDFQAWVAQHGPILHPSGSDVNHGAGLDASVGPFNTTQKKHLMWGVRDARHQPDMVSQP
jgi:hypothetical protein